MKNRISTLKTAVGNFHNNESGANAMETVMLLALAAIAGVAIYKFGGQVVNWCQKRLTEAIKPDEYQGVNDATVGQ